MMLQRILLALTLALLPSLATAQSDGVIDTQEEYDAAAAEGQRLYDAGDWTAAAAWLGPFADLAEGLFGPGHPETLHYRTLQVFALERLQKWGDVLAVAERAVAAAETAGPAPRESLPIMLDLRGSYGRGLFASGQNERALAMADAVVVQAQAMYGPEAAVIVVHSLDRARAARAIGGTDNLERAAEDYAFVARVTGATPDPGANAFAVNALREGAEVLRRLGRPRDAADQLALAIPMLERLHGSEAYETLTAMLAQVDALIDLSPADTSNLTPESLSQYISTFELATEVSRRAEQAFGQESPIAAESMAQRGWLLLLYNGGIMGAQGVQLGVTLVNLGLQLMERELPADDPRLVTWRMAWLSILGRLEQPSPDMALRGVAVARAAVRQRAAGLAAVSMALQAAQRAGALTPEQAAEEALFALQELQFGMAPAVMGFWQRRLEQGTGPAHDLHRAFTDTTLKGRTLEKDLLALLSQPLATRDAAAQAATEAALADNRVEGDRLSAQLAALDPTFGANFAGATLSLVDLRALIGPDEAVVVAALPDMRVNDAAGIILAVSDDAIAWAPLDLPPGDYLHSVDAIRQAVQLQLGVRAAISLSQDTAAEPRRVTFDASAAHRLYADTLAKVATVTTGKAHLYLDLRGALSMLPPQIMLVSPPTGDDLSGADWLIRHHALTVIPSLTSLRTVALARAGGRAPEAVLAFGDPDYAAAADAAPALASLRGSLAPLPETADEVRAVALALGSGDAALRLSGQASEAALKSEDLAQYRVLHFATHGLLSGDAVAGGVLGEPALALTPGQGQDGFLRASEVLDLRLNADLVVLSACNTALGGKGEDEALSGLAQAFLYAGSRALLVSHWPVESRSAAYLMTRTFDLRGQNPGLRNAEVQRRAMLELIDGDGPRPEWSHPAYWGPFVLVGNPD